jgi:hypothetical protein
MTSHRPPDLSADERGVALVIALIVMLIVFVLGSGLAVTMLTDTTASANYRSFNGALWEAEAGLQMTIVDLTADPTWARDVVNFSTIPMVLEDPFPTTLDINGNTVNIPLSGGVPVPGYIPLGAVTTLDDGTYTREIWLPPISLEAANGSGNRAWLVVPVSSVGTSGAVEGSTVRVRSDLRVTVRRLTIWDNALFGGAGQGGKTINGNVEIRGSIHIVGDPANVLDLGGGAAVINNYSNAADSSNWDTDAVKLPTVPTRMFEGELVQTLDAEVRVKEGTINLDGTAFWGEPDVSGNAYKETLDGFYHDVDPTLGGSASINPDEDSGYDAVGLAFPTLDDPYYDAATATNYPSHRNFLDTNALVVPINQIDSTIPSFDFSDANGNRLRWNQGSETLTIDGIIKVNGTLDLVAKHERLEYEGTGTIYATQDIAIHGHFVTKNDYLNTASPNPDNIGLIADEDIHISTGGGETWSKVMGALYAEDETFIAKQSRIVGAIVSNFFDMGVNVPGIWQAMGLATHLPPGMPGADPLLFVTGADVTNWYQDRQ